MSENIFDRYKAGRSVIHQLDPRTKLVVTVLFTLSNVLLPDGMWVGFLLVWGVLLFWCHLAKLGWGFTFVRSFVVLPFAVAAITVVFTLPGYPLFTLQVGGWEFVVSDAGLIRYMSILARSWLSVQAAILLTATTSFPDLAYGLRHLYIPEILVSTISFMVRYLHVLSAEASRLMKARAARSARLPGRKGGGLLWRARVTGNMIGQLFVRSYERSDRVFNAMLARGYNGELLTINSHRMQRIDWISGILVVIVLLGIQIYSRI
jgi:cobalt/nickel transport system permease protein